MKTGFAALAALVIAAQTSPALAQSAEVSVALGRFKTTVVDLTPDDGQDAWFSYLPTARSQSTAFVDGLSQWVDEPGPFTVTQAWVSAPLGQALGRTGGALLSAAVINNGLNDRAVARATFYGMLELGAHSSLTVTATAFFDTVQDFDEWHQMQASYGLRISDNVNGVHVRDEFFYDVYGPDADNNVEDVTIVFQNNSDQTLLLDFVYFASAGSLLVPEPESAVLLLAGLGLLALRKRRR